MTARDIRARYQGLQLGMLWSLLTPLAMLLAYTFVFHFVLKARWGISAEETALEFALTLFAGLLVFNIFAECVTRAPSLILAHANFVKKVVFPLEILPVNALAATLFYTLVSLLIVGLAWAVLVRTPGAWALLLPVLLAPYLCFVLGLSWVLASLGTFLRDLGPTIGLLTQLLIFLTPVFYPLHIVPEPWRQIMQLNPLAIYVENTRRLLLWNLPPTWTSLGLTAAGSLLVMLAGYVFFMKSKKAFGDVV
jgi:lipopolysaccharide transport system permease protein